MLSRLVFPLVVVLCSSCFSGTISVKLTDVGGGLGFEIHDSYRKDILRSAKGVTFVRAINQDTVDTQRLLKVEDTTPKDGVYHCLTDEGARVDIILEVRGSHAKITILPVGWKTTKIMLTWTAENGEDFYGGGEVWNGGINQRGRILHTSVRSGTPDECCYVPFYLSSLGYGIFVDSYEDGTFSFGIEDTPNQVGITFNTIDSQGITFYYIVGPTPKDVVCNYTAITGRPPLPPKWSFLPWKWRDEHRSWDEVFEDAEGMRKYDIPCSVQWIDNPWQKYGLCSFEFDPERFPDAEKRIKELKDMGYKVLVWVAPFTNPGVPNYEIALERGYLVKNPKGEPYKMGGGVYIDLTNSEAYEWWKQEMKKIIHLGIDGFKLDRGQDIQPDAVFFDGSTGASMRNKYALLYCKVCFEALREELGSRFTMLPRAGSAGAQVYSPGHWPGDLSSDFSTKSGLGAAIIAGQSIGLAGYAFWGSDIGGFEGTPSTDVFCRWAQFGCFSPIMELGGKDSVDQNWNPKRNRIGAEVYRYYATLHAELLPYTYTYAIIAHKTGLPIMRPLVLEFPEDARARSQDFEYLYGDHILVAPICNDTGIRDIYLPQGEWVDYWDWTRVYRGATNLSSVHFPLERIPVYIRNGAIIPLEVTNAVAGHSGTYSRDKLTVLVFPKEKSHFTILDNGRATDFWVQEGPSTVKIMWRNLSRPLLLRVRTKTVTAVKSPNGKQYVSCEDLRSYAGRPGTWYFDRVSGCVHISPIEGTTSVEVDK
ncbi:MAG: hypothetical protein K6U00_08060 [Armatimonadetes bacterium]|nr:hypothetical protein [Armatimonadota bacterium]